MAKSRDAVAAEDGHELPPIGPMHRIQWRFTGLSMPDAGFHDGDPACAPLGLTPDHGGNVATAVNGEMSIRGMGRAPARGGAELPVYALSVSDPAMRWNV